LFSSREKVVTVGRDRINFGLPILEEFLMEESVHHMEVLIIFSDTFLGDIIDLSEINGVPKFLEVDVVRTRDRLFLGGEFIFPIYHLIEK